MLTVFKLTEDRLEQHKVRNTGDLTPDVLWVDLREPTDREWSWVAQVYGQRLPELDEVDDIEESARFREDDRGVHITSFFFHEGESGPTTVPVSFNLYQGRLFTRRAQDLSSFRVFRMRARRQPGYVNDAMGILLELLDTKVEVMADTLEGRYASLDTLTHMALRPAADEMTDVLSQLATSEDINGKIRLALMDNQRVLSYLARRGQFSNEQRQQMRDMVRDVESLIAHTSFLFNKINFLMDTTMGMINIQQNKIIKIFSIAAVVFLPPTLVASIYGMNFQFMPELALSYGYPMALALMILAGIAPYLYFKRKGWL